MSLIGSISDAYVFRSVQRDDGSANHIATPPSFYYNGACNVNFTLYTSASSASFPFSMGNSWYSPDNILKLTSSPSFSQNIDCLSLNPNPATSSASLNNYYETKTTSTSTASISTSTFLVSDFDCTADSNNNILYDNTQFTDSFGNQPYSVYTQFSCCALTSCTITPLATQLNTIKSKIQDTFYGIPKGHCGTSWDFQNTKTGNGVSCASGGLIFDFNVQIWIMFPFNSMYAGQINLTASEFNIYLTGVTIPAGCGGGSNPYVYLFDPVLNTTTLLSTTLPYSVSNPPLVKNREYWIFLSYICDTSAPFGTGGVRFNYTIYNMTIFSYIPSLSCTDWGNCQNGTQFRNCIDLNGIITPFVDQRSCFEFAQRQEFLGFDDYNSVNVWYCSEGSLFGGCSMSSEIKTRKYPKNWTIVSDLVTDSATGRTGYLQDFVDMSNTIYYQEDAGTTETSLKMWYIPRKSWLPKFNESGDNQVRCNETTEGRVPYVYRDINQSFWIARNITATSPYMSLSYRLKECDEPELQTTGGFGCFGLGLTKGCNSTGIDLYTWNGCTEKPKATIGVSVRDLDLSQFVIDYAQEVTANTFDEGYFEDVINNLQLNHTYEIEFAVPPRSGLQDPSSYCVYIDDVNINFRNVPVICESGCFDDYDQNGIKDYTYLEATPRDSSSCSVKLFELDQRCVPTDVSDEVAAKQDFCIGLTLYTYNNVTERWETLENAQKCITEQQQQNITGINPLIGGILSSANVSQSDIQNSGFGFALTTIFIVFIIDLAISGYIGFKVKHWEAMAITMIGLIIIQTIPPLNVFPIWFSVVFVIFLSLFLAEFILRRYRGG
jgi:hypothetical protein